MEARYVYNKSFIEVHVDFICHKKFKARKIKMPLVYANMRFVDSFN